MCFWGGFGEEKVVLRGNLEVGGGRFGCEIAGKCRKWRKNETGEEKSSTKTQRKNLVFFAAL
jgi:hypothetical protein